MRDGCVYQQATLLCDNLQDRLYLFFASTVHLKLGEVADPYAPVWIQLVGEKGESGQIQIKPGYGPQDKFEKGRIYKVVARVADIGRVSEGAGVIPGVLFLHPIVWATTQRIPNLFTDVDMVHLSNV